MTVQTVRLTVLKSDVVLNAAGMRSSNVHDL